MVGGFSDELLSPNAEDRMRNTSYSLGHSLKKRGQRPSPKTSRGNSVSPSPRGTKELAERVQKPPE